MLEVQHLYRSYRTIPAVEDVSFRVAAGEIVGFLGPNGAGKSTTVKIITGMLRPDDGKVLFEGRNIREDMDGVSRGAGICAGRGAPVCLSFGPRISATGGAACAG